MLQAIGQRPGFKGYLWLTACFMALIYIFLQVPAFAEDPLAYLAEETLSYFKPLKGRVLAVNGSAINTDLGIKAGLKKGMRLAILREGAAFLHPVTKEPIGRAEAPVGTAVVTEVESDSSSMEVIKGEAGKGDIVRISEIKLRVMFYQDKNVDWSIADSYYSLLKESGRIEIIDTPFDSGDDQAVLSEAKRLGAHIALLLRSEASGKEAILKQRLLWVDDASSLADINLRIDNAFAKDIKFGDGTVPVQGEALLSFSISSGARLIATGDIDGDGRQELILNIGREIGVYVPGVSLHKLYEIKGTFADDYLWLDTLDINGDGRDEIIVTSLRNDEIVSSIYELKGQELVLLLKTKLFLRKMNETLIAQEYNVNEGFSGSVFGVAYKNGELKRLEALKIPKDVNIYDFVQLGDQNSINNTLAYDNAGFLNLYNKTGLRIWQSSESYGGFPLVFKKSSAADRGEWSVKNRLALRNRQPLAVKKIPFVEMAKGLGYKSSQVRVLSWTGLSIDERTLVSDIPGSLIDYAIAGDKLVVITKPLFGIKPQNIFKGESPIGSMLYIYSIKGR